MIENQMFGLFNEHKVHGFIQIRDGQIEYAINNAKDNEILNADQIIYAKDLMERFKVEPLNFDFESTFAMSEEKGIPFAQNPRDFTVRNSGMGVGEIKRMVLSYCIPFTGDIEMLRLQPTSHSMNPKEFYINNGNLCFDIIDFYNDSEIINRDAESYLDYVKMYSSYLNNDISQFNNTLEKKITRLFTLRKNKLLQQKNILANLRVPIKKIESSSGAINIPIKRKQIIIKSPANSKEFLPDPAISYDDYMSILKAINEIGKSFERLPSNYVGKNEEGLRDLFLSSLSLAFESASISGETFNKKGKTDILIKYESNNVFLAECKFWRGAKKHPDTIDQLLSYLTWRDSKTAIIYFVDNKNLQPVLDAINV